MSYWSHHPEKLDEITIENLPEPYKTWCETGEKPFPWWKTAYLWPLYQCAKVLEKWIPDLREGFVERPGNRKGKIFQRGLAFRIYPYGTEFYTSEVPDNILYRAMNEGVEDYWSGLADSAMASYETQLMEGKGRLK